MKDTTLSEKLTIRKSFCKCCGQLCEPVRSVAQIQLAMSLIYIHKDIWTYDSEVRRVHWACFWRLLTLQGIWYEARAST